MHNRFAAFPMIHKHWGDPRRLHPLWLCSRFEGSRYNLCVALPEVYHCPCELVSRARTHIDTRQHTPAQRPTWTWANTDTEQTYEHMCQHTDVHTYLQLCEDPRSETSSGRRPAHRHTVPQLTCNPIPPGDWIYPGLLWAIQLGGAENRLGV